MRYDLIFKNPSHFSIKELLEALHFWQTSICPNPFQHWMSCPVCGDMVSSKKLHLHMRTTHGWKKDELSSSLCTVWGGERVIFESAKQFRIGMYRCTNEDGSWQHHYFYEGDMSYYQTKGLPYRLTPELVSWWYSLDSTCWIGGQDSEVKYWPSHIEENLEFNFADPAD